MDASSPRGQGACQPHKRDAVDVQGAQPLTVAPLFQDTRGARMSASEGSTLRGARSAQKGKPSVRCRGAACVASRAAC